MYRTPFLTSGAVLNSIVEGVVCAGTGSESIASPIGCDRTSGNEVPWRAPINLLRIPKTSLDSEVRNLGTITRWLARRSFEIKAPNVCL